ncbi:DDE-type integrase/transposase/recombinase, partial [Streptomyces sp. NPDC021356]|uniref:DDE-type integrase/transposase/recombinase n=1 Tax=Streptomyces sp. NPDC021356 TaxID=3154900 RepID=UPI0034029DB4
VRPGGARSAAARLHRVRRGGARSAAARLHRVRRGGARSAAARLHRVRPGGARSAAARLHRVRPQPAWAGDITYLPIAGGKFLYLATVIDVFSRRLPGWSMADHMRAELVTDALNGAVRTRGAQVGGVIFHSDHGAQGGSKAFVDACRQAGVRRSMGAVGTSADNAAAESFFASLKRELLPDRRGWPNERAARLPAFH